MVSRSVVVRPAGSLDPLAVDHIRQSLRPLTQSGYRYFIFDLAETDFVNSCGLGLLIEFYNHLNSIKGSLRLVNCSDKVMRVLKQTKLDRILLENESEQLEGPVEVPSRISFECLHPMMDREVLFAAQLNQLLEDILLCDDYEVLGERILDGIHSSLAISSSLLYALDNKRETLNLVASRGSGGEVSGSERCIDLAKDPQLSAIIERGEIASYESATCGSDQSEEAIAAHPFGIEKPIVIPIEGKQSPLGIIAISSANIESGENGHLVPLLRCYANLGGIALEKCETMTALNRQFEELKRKNESVLQLEDAMGDVGKLAAVGSLLSSIGHVANNKLVPIMGYSQLLRGMESVSDKAKDRISDINTAAIELHDVMENLINLSKVREPGEDGVDINEIIGNTILLLGCQLEADEIELRTELQENLPIVYGNREHLLQAILVILHRAMSSFSNRTSGRWISVSTHLTSSSVVVEIEDNGEGLAAMTHEQWIDPEIPFSKKGKGCLFNYSIAQKIVHRHRGSFRFEECEVGEGSRVVFSLPIDQGQNANDLFEEEVLEDQDLRIA